MSTGRRQGDFDFGGRGVALPPAANRGRARGAPLNTVLFRECRGTSAITAVKARTYRLSSNKLPVVPSKVRLLLRARKPCCWWIAHTMRFNGARHSIRSAHPSRARGAVNNLALGLITRLQRRVARSATKCDTGNLWTLSSDQVRRGGTPTRSLSSQGYLGAQGSVEARRAPREAMRTTASLHRQRSPGTRRRRISIHDLSDAGRMVAEWTTHGRHTAAGVEW